MFQQSPHVHQQRKAFFLRCIRPVARCMGVPLPSDTNERSAPSHLFAPLHQHALLLLPPLCGVQHISPTSSVSTSLLSRMQPRRIALGFALSSAIGGLAYWRGSLTGGGWLGAIITGTLTMGFGGVDWGTTLVTFFVSSSALSHYKQSVKEQRTGNTFAKGARRDMAQALANGGPGAVLALAYGLLGEPPCIKALFTGVMATAAADTWATELGVLSTTKPRLITTLQVVEPGTSGAVSSIGTIASAAGGLLIGVMMWGLHAFTNASPPSSAPPATAGWLVPAGLLGGLAGSLSDSLMAATIQVTYRTQEGRETERSTAHDGTPNTYLRGFRWLNNDLVNMSSTLTGGLVAVAVLAIARKWQHTSAKQHMTNFHNKGA